MPRLLSGIQPTGELHLGNLVGAVENWVRLQDDYECFFCIVDYHAITIEYDRALLAPRVLQAATELLACGLDPDRCTLFVQSAVPEHTELAWILGCLTGMGELLRMTQYKQKTEDDKQFASLGLFAYPVLQAADIALYRGEQVPVGEDQKQHLELCRDLIRRFNHRFGATFPEPEAVLTAAPRLLGLDGQKKMSKSLGNHLALTLAPEEVERKIAREAFTDPQRLRRSDPGRPELCNVFSYHEVFSPAEDCAEIAAACRSAAIGCVDCKRKVAARINARFDPIRARHAALAADPDRVRDVLAAGAARARAVAAAVMADVRRALGLFPTEPS